MIVIHSIPERGRSKHSHQTETKTFLFSQCMHINHICHDFVCYFDFKTKKIEEYFLNTYLVFISILICVASKQLYENRPHAGHVIYDNKNLL